ncbi:hypothetical protein V5799_012171 [Amblyomma americanum]|uniref:Uncharacterized protein n=1 Tax=Amblyomma americanum TaxID=6943 RepID=A0AAQ4EF70_AMBAM
MRTSWVLFLVFILIFWQLWHYLLPLRQVSLMAGSVWVTLRLSYCLSRLVWQWAFVKMVPGDGKAVLITADLPLIVRKGPPFSGGCGPDYAGCGQGFGYRLAKRLSREGFLVFAGCRNAKCKGAEELRSLNNVKVLQLDVTKQAEVDDALDAVRENLGKRVVPNAGIGSGGLLEWCTVDTVSKVFDINVFGAMRVIKKFLPLLKKHEGRVVTIASPLGNYFCPWHHRHHH